MPNSTQSGSAPKPKSKFRWTHDAVYNAVMSKLWRAMKCRIYPEDTVFMLYEADLMDSYLDNNGKITKRLFNAVCNIEKTFNIRIVNNYTFDDIISVAEWKLEKQGRLAPDVPDIESIKMQQHKSTGRVH